MLDNRTSDQQHYKTPMNRFIHRIVSARTRDMVSRSTLYQDLFDNKKLVYLGELHSEPRIAAFQNDLLQSLVLLQSSTANDGLQEKDDEPPRRRLHVVMEHFSIAMQGILDRFQTESAFGFADLKSAYQEIGTEGHDLDSLKDFLRICKQHYRNEDSSVRLHGGFIPRPLAARLHKAENDNQKRILFQELYENDYLPNSDSHLHSAVFLDKEAMLLQGSPSHFRLIQSLMTGQNLYAPADNEPDETISIGSSTPIEKLYQAQLLKDHVMGYQLFKLMKRYNQPHDHFLVVVGMGHLKHSLGVPECLERYWKAEAVHFSTADIRQEAMTSLLSCMNSSALVGCQMLYETYLEERYEPLQIAVSQLEEADGDDDETKAEEAKRKALNQLALEHSDLMDEFILESEVIRGPMFNFQAGVGRFEKPSFDYCFVYDEDDDNVLPDKDGNESSSSDNARAETVQAYNQVGSTASHKGNLIKAKAIMQYLQYTEHDLDLIGDEDLYNFQGVANPHRVANIQPGELVLDVGSGLGVDSFLAEAKGATVVGVDLAANQVSHASVRAQARGIQDKVQFLQGNVESLSESLEQNGLCGMLFDVCISNGAFCLIPDKQKAFQQVFEALQPGGRMAISTTTLMPNQKLGLDHEWPVCMRMFANLETLKPMCQQIGFEDVKVLDAESPMEGMELPEEAFQEDTQQQQSEESGKRFKIHGKYADQYKYLEDMDMDKLCKVVTVYGVKPLGV